MTMSKNREDLTAFCESRFPELHGALTLYCGDSYIAEEFAQEALVRAFIRWDRVRQMDHPEAWLHRVGLNLAKSYFRRKSAEHAALSRRGVGQQDNIDSPEATSVVRDALMRLPRRARQALILRYFSGFNVAETAAAMDCSERTVKRLSSRALQDLRLGDTDALLSEVRNAG